MYFFTGANPFVLSFDKLKTLAGLVKKYYPKSESIGCFARITDIKPKTTEQLKELRRLGYNSITIGVEAGDDEALSFMHKGFGTKEIIEECKRLDAATWITIFFLSRRNLWFWPWRSRGAEHRKGIQPSSPEDHRVLHADNLSYL